MNYSHSRSPPVSSFVGAPCKAPCFSWEYKWLQSTFHGVTELSGIAEADMNPLIAVSTLFFIVINIKKWCEANRNSKKGEQTEKKKANGKMCAREIVMKCKENQVIDNLISKKTTNADILDCVSSLYTIIFRDVRLMIIFFVF